MKYHLHFPFYPLATLQAGNKKFVQEEWLQYYNMQTSQRNWQNLLQNKEVMTEVSTRWSVVLARGRAVKIARLENKHGGQVNQQFIVSLIDGSVLCPGKQWHV